MNTREKSAFHNFTSGADNLMPVLRRHSMHKTEQALEILLTRMKGIILCLRDVEEIADRGCCCGEMYGKRTNRILCEVCLEMKGASG